MEEKKKPLVILSGATAVGKTDISLKLAERIGGSIISADSMQVYKGFDIGTAKIRPEEMKGIRHYLIDILTFREEFNVYEFQKRANLAVEEILSEGKIPIVVGGTGFYIQALLYGICFGEEDGKNDLRKQLEKLASEKGPLYMHQLLSEADPESAAIIHPHNQKRVIRALEYFRETGEKMSEHNARERKRESSFNYAYFVLNRERKEIYSRIDRRVDQMMADGLAEEVKGLLSHNVPRDCLAMQGLGYKETAAYLEGEITFEEAVYRIKRDTRHFAKRQITWFKREKDVIWMNYEDHEDMEGMLSEIIKQLKEKHIV